MSIGIRKYFAHRPECLQSDALGATLRAMNASFPIAATDSPPPAEHLFTPADVMRWEFDRARVSLRKIAAELGVSQSTVVRWCHARPLGCGGIIPSRYHVRLLELARARGVTLTPNDLVYGRKELAA